MEKVVYEQLFLLKYDGGWSFIESYSLPIKLREWFLARLTKQFEIEEEQTRRITKNTNKR
jgi:hypothetical protein